MTGSKPQDRRLGYARVSTYGQALDAQLDQLRKAGCTKIYREKVTGARADRRELLKLLKAVAPGDMVTVRASTGWRARPSACSPSSSRSWTPRDSFGHWRSRIRRREIASSSAGSAIAFSAAFRGFRILSCCTTADVDFYSYRQNRHRSLMHRIFGPSCGQRR
jgi:hypothetical protein